ETAPEIQTEALADGACRANTSPFSDIGTILKQTAMPSHTTFLSFLTVSVGCNSASTNSSFTQRTAQEPGVPFRILRSSIFHTGNPNPGNSSSATLGSEVIRHRETHAVVVIARGRCRMTNPVTRLCSTAS